MATLEERVAQLEADMQIVLKKMNNMDAAYLDLQRRLTETQEYMVKIGWFGKGG